jgi:hypothetical protein
MSINLAKQNILFQTKTYNAMEGSYLKKTKKVKITALCTPFVTGF